MTHNEFRDMRKALGMSQQELALEFETTARTVRRWETGAQPIPGAAKVAMRLMRQSAEMLTAP